MMGSYLPNAQQTLGTSWQYHGLDYTTENISSDFLFTLKRDTSQKKKKQTIKQNLKLCGHRGKEDLGEVGGEDYN